MILVTVHNSNPFPNPVGVTDMSPPYVFDPIARRDAIGNTAW